MADTVRYLMEQMVPELEDMVKQKYFSKEEVKQIVKRRQDFEYLLKRKATLKEDFLRYIEYESKLDALRAHRRQALGLEDRKKKSMSDFAMVRRIHFIFERAVRKFKTDLGLWTAWLEFCRNSNSNRRLGRVVARALHIHPTEPGLWVYAAAWEFEANGNPNAARALLQQGLRMCKYSQKMWLDVFDMELMYVEKEVARRRILGLDVPGDDDDSTPQQQQQQDGQQEPATGHKRRRGADAAGAASDAAAAGAAAAEEVEDGEGPESREEAAAAAEQPALNAVLTIQQEQQQDEPEQQQQQQAGLAEAQAAVKAVLNGAIARLVYQNALKAAVAAASKGFSSSNYLKPDLAAAGTGSSSSSLEFRAGFLKVLGRYTSPGVRRLQQEIVEGIRQDFPADPAAADLLARISCDPSDTAAPAEAFQHATQEFERLLGHPAATAAAAADASKGRPSKRQKQSATTPAAADTAVQEAAVPAVPRDVVPQVYRLYCGYVEERLQALLAREEQALAAAAVAQQLFKLLLSAHAAGAAEEGLYRMWVRLATQLQQSKVALKAARLATEAHPSSAAAWEGRIDLEAQALGCSTAATAAAAGSSDGTHPQQQKQQQLFGLVVQAVQQVSAADAVQLWETGFTLAESLAAAGSTAQLVALQKQLLSAVTAASVRGPKTGGLGAVAGRCLDVLWRASGAAAARKLWQWLLLLPPAGGDMFRAMVQLEQSAADAAVADASDPQQRRQFAAEGAKRLRGVYEAWAAAYGGVDAELWVEWALFEQQQGKAGAGNLYWRAVKALDTPEDFIAAYRQQIGAA